ncbi:MAG: bifunctional 4-hydroxy-2-oxoglutarate aldolase/2-dehydro-3-deoxy-phosphogluconate aldolase [Planctomycetes bacterium]|nr:bifunctional 4-hydroxy-2-oxoglutarate aldolase/2-dehydro-3-deoxy-phosphogluconate aldolase [Planctomycetota bacterium]
MARFRRLDVLRLMLDGGLVPVFYHRDPVVAFEVARACAAGGSRLLELTHRGDMAHRVFEVLIERCAAELPDLVLGVGSIGDPHTAALYLAAGASFVVGPVLNPEVARLANRRKVAYLPGCGSATEVAQAEELGCEVVKVFPGDSVGGPGFVKAILGPSPWSLLMPTGGVEATRESVQSWIRAGAAALGIGSSLISKDILERADFAALRARVAQVLAWIAEARRGPGQPHATQPRKE